MKKLKCFGGYQNGVENCRNCEYLVACQLYTATEGRMEQPLGGQDFSEVSDFDERMMVSDYPGMSHEQNGWNKMNTSTAELSNLLNFLFHLDDYSLGIVAEIVAPTEISSKKVTVADMARVHGISRQGMHRKILDLVGRNPELASLFKCVVLKIQKSRNSFRQGAYRRRKWHTKSKNDDK